MMTALVPIFLCCRTWGRGIRTRPALSLHRQGKNKYVRPGRMMGVEMIKAIHVSIGDERGIDITRWNGEESVIKAWVNAFSR